MSTNISGKKREALLSKIAEIKTFIEKNADEKNASQLLGYLGELSREVNGKKYGLVFEEHREKIDELLEKNAPVFTEEKKLFVDNGGELNFLLEGDNLASLKLLEKTHRGKIDVIYIDPPYNTGNKDFIYDDDFVDNEDSFRHSKWLSFMKPRLVIAKKLLSDSSAIFISIDDNEQSHLKVLCDEIFGERNYIGNIIIKSNPRGSMSDAELANLHEYLLVYAKKIDSVNILGQELSDDMIDEYKLEDEHGRYRLLGLRMRGGFWKRSERPNLYFPIYVNPKNCSISIEKKENYSDSVLPIQPSTMEDGTWRWSKEKIEKEAKYLIAKKIKRGEETVWDIYQKDYFEKEGERKTKTRSIWDKKELNYQNGTIEIKNIFGDSKVFNYSKPVQLIQEVVKIMGLSSSPTILDFFAGSGTTGHAVLKLNAEDGGHRKFILCTNNENNICRDITYQRLKTAITGKRKDKSKYSDGLPGSLKYFKTDFIPVSEKMYYEYADELLLHVRELVELENAVNFEKDTSVAIVLDDDEMEVFVKRIVGSSPTMTGCSPTMTVDSPIKTLYLGHDVLLSAKQERILKAHNISVNIIPDYYYRELAL
ncbi:MAG: site-specific DNA-methyltransferase [Treponema sp.]|nr:site-specific DNA-methyltransferase [Treponema sp.]